MRRGLVDVRAELLHQTLQHSNVTTSSSGT
jgi:hypothetical protein